MLPTHGLWGRNMISSPFPLRMKRYQAKSLFTSISNCILHYIILYYIIFCNTILYYITIYFAASHYIILCCILSYCMLYHIILFKILFKNHRRSTILHRTLPFHYSHYFSTSNSLQFHRTLLYQLRDLNCAHWLM